MTAVYVIMIIVAVIMLLLLIPINVVFSFAFKSDENEIRIKILFWDKRVFPAVKEETEETEIATNEKKKISVSGIKQLLKKLKTVYSATKTDIKKLINYIFVKALSIKELNISALIGTGDPMYTGIVYGAVNAAVYGGLGAAYAKMKIKDYNVDIKADFDNAKLATGIYTVLYVRILNLFPIAVYALRIYLKARKALKEEKINE